MCKRIVKHAEDWPAIKLHRGLGFIQAGMIANLMLDLTEPRRCSTRSRVSTARSPTTKTSSTTLIRRSRSRSVVRVEGGVPPTFSKTGLSHRRLARGQIVQIVIRYGIRSGPQGVLLAMRTFAFLHGGALSAFVAV